MRGLLYLSFKLTLVLDDSQTYLCAKIVAVWSRALTKAAMA